MSSSGYKSTPRIIQLIQRPVVKLLNLSKVVIAGEMAQSFSNGQNKSCPIYL
jgi:hypothetical protein